MIFGYGTTKSNDRLKRARGTGRDNSRRGDIPVGYTQDEDEDEDTA